MTTCPRAKRCHDASCCMHGNSIQLNRGGSFTGVLMAAVQQVPVLQPPAPHDCRKGPTPRIRGRNMFVEPFQNMLCSSSEPSSWNAVKRNRRYPVLIIVKTRNRFASCVRVDKVSGSDAATMSCLKLGKFFVLQNGGGLHTSSWKCARMKMPLHVLVCDHFPLCCASDIELDVDRSTSLAG